MVLHFHGTPITPRSVLLSLAGRCFCVSFAAPRDVQACHEIGQAVMLDNGAFTAWRQGRPVRDWSAYYAWCASWLEHWTTWAVIPDVIDGDEAANDALVEQWPFGDRGAPVWHMHERLDRLDRLIDRWPLVCLGSSGAYAKMGSRAWRGRMAEAMDVACDTAGRPRTRLHLLRGLRWAAGPYPLYSADSTSVAQNHAGNRSRATPRKDAVRMAAAIDARQPPASWQAPRHRQLELIAGTRRKPEDYVREAIECSGCPIKSVCLISGGGDSTVTAHRCRDLYDELAFIDTGTALPGVREFVIEFAAWLGKPLRIFDSGDAYRDLVLGDSRWWAFYRRERRPRESVSDFVVRTTPDRRSGDGLGNAPQGFPGPGGGHRAAYARLKERQIEALLREAKQGRGRHERVALLSGARRYESRRRSMTQGVEGWRARGSQLWINPLNDWRNDEVHAYRQQHGIPQSDVAALLHRSGECNCGAYMSAGEVQDVRALYPDWHREAIRPLEEEAREAGIPRHVWGERTDTGRPGARGFPFDGVDAAQLALNFDQGVPAAEAAGALCSSCATDARWRR